MKNIKKYLIALSVLTILISPSFSSAATVEELQAQIAALLAQIQQLQAQLAQLHGPAPVWCHDFNVNLSIGHEADSELGALWTALAKEGFSVQAGKFDETTASAVSGFQQKYTSEILTPWGLQYGTGFVGKTTRAKLNKLYGCGIECPLYSLPLCKEGEKIVSGGYAANGCALPGKCVPIVVCAPPPCPEGDYTHYNTGKISAYGCPIIICVPISGNQPPVISGVSGPTALKIGETGTWTVKASDPEQGVLSYSVRWGDENITGAYSAAQRNWSYTQSATFTHSYASAEVYNPTFTVTDNQGLSAKTSISVQVGEVTTPSITVLSPNGGEKWQKDSTQLIKWSAPSTISSVDIYLTFEFDPRLMMVIAIPTPRLLVSNTPNDGLFEWKVDMIGGALTNGYQIKIVDSAHATISDTSDAPFSIVAAGTLAPSGQYSASILENIKATLDQIQKTINSWR